MRLLFPALLLAAVGCGDSSVADGGGTDARSSTDAGPGHDAGPGTDAGPGHDAGPPGTRTVTNATIAFDGTETDLARQYGLYVQDPSAEVDVVADPLGTHGDVLYFRKPKDSGDWAHVMVRLMDKRIGYTDVVQVAAYESAYHYHQQIYLGDDPQYDVDFMNVVEDFHCEPCEANNLQLYSSYRTGDSLCVWITYSTDPSFDPRGPDRGGSTDPWETISPNNVFPTIAADGTATLSGPLPPTGAVLLCRDDVPVSSIRGRWVDFEMIIKPSSHDTGRVLVWIDGHPYFYEGPNAYRYNQDAGENAVNIYQVGLYGGQTSVMSGTPTDWELWTTPPFLELGDDVDYVP